MKEKYNIVISERQAVPRSKRMREAGQSSSSAAVLVSGTGGGGSSCDGHVHTNLPALERIGFDENDDKYLMVRVGSVDDETGELVVTHEKIKSGYADKAHDLDEDSPIYEKFIRKDKEDRTDGLLRLLGGTITDNIESQEFLSGVLGTGFLIKRDSVTGKSYAEIDEIYVRLKAVFDTLEIRHSTHVGGQQILSPAGMTCIRVEEYDTCYRCFMKADDGSKAIQNLFAENDQAQCRDINVKECIYENVSNQYYWRLVVGVGDDYIDLSKDDCDTGSTVPAAGDNICQLGNRLYKERQNAIVISSYGSDSPSFKQYAGIDSYSLEGREVTVLSPSGNELSGKLHIQPGSTGWQSLDGLPEGIKEAADSAISGIEFGKNNLLRNSGFTGDYQTANLNSDTSLDETSELYSPSLKYWDVVNAVAQESEISISGKEVVIKSGSMTQVLFYRIISGESYIFSFYGKGTSVTFSCGGYAETIPLTDEYKRYICRFRTLSAGSILSIHSATGSFCELQLERGTVPSSWGASMMDNTSELAHYQELEYLASAIKDGSVDILGGLVLANILQLGNYKDGRMHKVTAGISGIYNNDDDVFAFGGGTLEQAISTVAKYKDNPSYQPNDEELGELAKIVLTHGGRSILNDVVMRGYIYGLGGIFKGKVVTGLTGNRIELDPLTNSIKMYNGSGKTVFLLSFTEGEHQQITPVLVLNGAVNGEYENTYTKIIGSSVEGSTMYSEEGANVDIKWKIDKNGISFKKNGREISFSISDWKDNNSQMRIKFDYLPDASTAQKGELYSENGFIKIK